MGSKGDPLAKDVHKWWSMTLRCARDELFRG
jgi:hypothetical protein